MNDGENRGVGVKLAWSRWVAPRRAGTGAGSVPKGPGVARRTWAARRVAAVGAVAVLLGQLLGGHPAAAQAGGLPGSAFPLVLDVDLTPNPVCSGAVHGRVQMYDPAAAKAGATVEWRVRAGEEQLAGGRLAMAAHVGTAEFSIPFDRVPGPRPNYRSTPEAGASGDAPAARARSGVTRYGRGAIRCAWPRSGTR